MTVETRIIDDFLDSEHFAEFAGGLFDGNMPLFYSADALPKGEGEQEDGANGFFQFTHGFYLSDGAVVGKPTEHFGNVEAIVNKVGYEVAGDTGQAVLFRAKVNVIARTEKNMSEGFHCDRTYSDKLGTHRMSPHVVALLYLNTTNGPTIFEDGEIIDCVANRLVIFDGSRRHTSSSCTDQKIRAALNMNYFHIPGGEIVREAA